MQRGLFDLPQGDLLALPGPRLIGVPVLGDVSLAILNKESQPTLA